MIARTALLLAAAVLCQSLRLLIPMPAIFSTFLIGTLVNACLLIALRTCGLSSAVFIAAVTPFIAYFQGLLPFPVFVPAVALGNSAFVALFAMLERKMPYVLAAVAAAAGKALTLYFLFLWMLSWVDVPAALGKGLLFVMGWPQLVTGILGALLARVLQRRLQAALGVTPKRESDQAKGGPS
jgi:hypothetical protein